MEDNNSILIQLLNGLTELKNDLKHMEKEINSIKKNKNVNSNSNTNTNKLEIMEVKSEKLDIPEEFIRRCIKYGNIRGDILMIKYWYLDKSNEHPIRNINRIRWEFWCNGTWNIDIEGEYIKEVMSKNIQKAYLSVNTFDYYSDDFDLFIENQKHIHELNDPKYKKKL